MEPPNKIASKRLILEEALPNAAPIGHCKGRKIFVDTSDLVKRSDNEIEKAFSTTQSKLQKIKQELANIFQYVHQRSAQIGSVTDTHECWTTKLKTISIEIKQLKMAVEDQRPYIPYMQN